MADGPFPNLRSFLRYLDDAGELSRVRVPVDPLLEVAAVADRVMKSPAPSGHGERDRNPQASLGGRALVFEDVAGAELPLCINAYGSYRRVCAALGTPTLDDLADRVGKFVKPELPATLWEKLKLGREVVGDLAALRPKRVKDAACQEVVSRGSQVDLFKLPIIQCWPHDGDLQSGQVFSHLRSEISSARSGTGRYITLGGIYTVNPENGDKNIGMYRVQVFDRRTCAMHWHLHHDGARHFRLWQQRGEAMPVAVALGGPSVMPYAATAPLPPGIPEIVFAAFLNRRPIDLVKCVSHDIEVPAEAEIIIEGFVHPTETVIEGPFGDHTGFYSLADRYPRFDVTAITRRKDAIYPTTIVGKPPMEDYFLGKATERVFLPLLKTIVPDIVDYSLPMAGCFHNCVYVKIKKEYAYQARRVMHAVWGAGQMAFTKFVVVVDEDVDVHDEQQVLFHLFANCDPARDTEVVRGPVDILDHASPGLGVGSKMGFDATRKLASEAGESVVRDWPAELGFDGATRAKVEARWAEYGL